MTAFSDSFFLQFSREWLLHYARSMRHDADLVERLVSQRPDFELVPVPRRLLDQLALLPGGGEVDWAGTQMSSLWSSLPPAASSGKAERSGESPRDSSEEPLQGSLGERVAASDAGGLP